MTQPPIHFFLWYSRADEIAVRRLLADLKEAGISVWIDTEGLTPGTANWERALRRALGCSYGVILAASPAARDSSFVQAELALAQSLFLPTIPLWIRGDSWIQSVPNGHFPNSIH